MRIVRVFVPALALVAAFLGAVAAPADAATFDVYPGQSIQAAIDAAPPGSTIRVHAGTYRESLVIAKDNIRLIGDGDNGNGTVLKPPRSSDSFCAESPTVFPGICVAGQFDDEFNLIGTTTGTEIAGFMIRNFPADGVIMFGTDHSSIHDDTAANNGDYGFASFVSTGNTFNRLRALSNGEPAFYIGDSPDAQFTLTNSTATDNGMGLLVREANNGTIAHNTFNENCVGIFVLNHGGPPGNPRVTNWSIHDNTANANNKVCEGDEEEPPISGAGIVLAGPKDVTVDDNVVRNNVGSAGNPFAGGIVLVSSAEEGGNNPVNVTISNNIARGNQPYDIRWDRTGRNNTFVNNNCDTSKPAFICEG